MRNMKNDSIVEWCDRCRDGDGGLETKMAMMWSSNRRRWKLLLARNFWATIAAGSPRVYHRCKASSCSSSRRKSSGDNAGYVSSSNGSSEKGRNYSSYGVTCPDHFKWIERDLEPWKKSKISRSLLKRARQDSAFESSFRVVLKGGKVYAGGIGNCYQTRAIFSLSYNSPHSIEVSCPMSSSCSGAGTNPRCGRSRRPGLIVWTRALLKVRYRMFRPRSSDTALPHNISISPSPTGHFGDGTLLISIHKMLYSLPFFPLLLILFVFISYLFWYEDGTWFCFCVSSLYVCQ